MHLCLVVALAGAGTMTVELAAVRLLAPWFGSSSQVWTNVIGVVLLALSLGYLLGARLSRSDNVRTRLGQVLLVAGALAAWLPAGARPVAELFLPEGLSLDQAASLFVWGSLAASAVLFLPAALALGCVGPLAVEELSRERGEGAGDAGGRILAASTVGSLVGTFATTHLFVPVLGLTATFLTAAAVLALLGASLLLPAGMDKAGRDKVGAASLLLLALGLGFSRADARELQDGRTRLATVESPYQHLEVIEFGKGDGRERWLQAGESFDSFQSVWRPQPGLLGYYYDYFVPPMHWDGKRGEWRVLVLGLGAGTAVRVMEGAMPEGLELDSIGVEIDPMVVTLGQEHFGLEQGAGRQVYAGLDARAALRTLTAADGFDQIIIDCYANNMEIPAHLSSVEFFREVRDALRPGGWVSVNVGGFWVEDPVVEAVGATMASAFEETASAARVPFSRNVMVYARREGVVPAPLTDGFQVPGAAEPLVSQLALPGAWRTFPVQDEAQVLTDDQNPIERLQLASIDEGFEGAIEAGAPTAGPMRLAAALERTLTLWRGGDLSGALGWTRHHLRLDPTGEENEQDLRCRLAWHGTEIAVQLGEPEAARELLELWRTAVKDGPFDEETRRQWIEGWEPGTGVEALAARHADIEERDDKARSHVARAQGTLGLTLLLGIAFGAQLLRRRS